MPVRIRCRLNALAAALLLAASPSGLPDTPGDVVVRARSFTIRRGELDGPLKVLAAAMAGQGITPDPRQREEMFRRCLDQLLLFRLCQTRATEADRTRAAGQADTFIAGRRRELGTEAFDRLVAQAGHSPESFREAKVAEALVSVVVRREVEETIRIPSADVKGYYDAHPEAWTEPGQVRLERLTVRPATDPVDAEAVRREAAELHRRAVAGEAFDVLARPGGAGPASVGSDRIVSPVDTLEPALAGAIAPLAPGGVTPPVATPDGFLVVRLLERIPERRRPLEAVESDIRALLVQRELATRVPEYFARIQREEGVERIGSGGVRP